MVDFWGGLWLQAIRQKRPKHRVDRIATAAVMRRMLFVAKSCTPWAADALLVDIPYRLGPHLFTAAKQLRYITSGFKNTHSLCRSLYSARTKARRTVERGLRLKGTGVAPKRSSPNGWRGLRMRSPSSAYDTDVRWLMLIGPAILAVTAGGVCAHSITANDVYVSRPKARPESNSPSSCIFGKRQDVVRLLS